MAKRQRREEDEGPGTRCGRLLPRVLNQFCIVHDGNGNETVRDNAIAKPDVFLYIRGNHCPDLSPGQFRNAIKHFMDSHQGAEFATNPQNKIHPRVMDLIRTSMEQHRWWFSGASEGDESSKRNIGNPESDEHDLSKEPKRTRPSKRFEHKAENGIPSSLSASKPDDLDDEPENEIEQFQEKLVSQICTENVLRNMQTNESYLYVMMDNLVRTLLSDFPTTRKSPLAPQLMKRIKAKEMEVIKSFNDSDAVGFAAARHTNDYFLYNNEAFIKYLGGDRTKHKWRIVHPMDIARIFFAISKRRFRPKFCHAFSSTATTKKWSMLDVIELKHIRVFPFRPSDPVVYCHFFCQYDPMVGLYFWGFPLDSLVV